MQLWPNDDGPGPIDRARAALAEPNPMIGLDWGNTGVHDGVPLSDLTPAQIREIQNAHADRYGAERTTAVLPAFSNLQVGEIGLIRGGGTPVALVEVIGGYQFETQTTERHWFRHRFPVRVLGWYKDDRPRYGLQVNPPAPGAFQSLPNDTPTRRAIDAWHEHIRRSQVIETLRHFGQICLSGPPGTGKTHRARALVAEMLGLAPDSEAFVDERRKRWDIVQFHPAYNYEDFVRGIAARTSADGPMSFEIEDRIFASMCARARADAREHVLIIDEINRAHLPAVFGELLYALEYRGDSVTTASGTSLVVPPNLFVIGTMNTADRSIGHLDYAVRRRFAFVRCHPDLAEIVYPDGELQARARAAFAEVARIFAEFRSPDAVTIDVQPGHTYFMKAKDDAALRRKITAQVVPLLDEYVADGILLAGATARIRALDGAYGAP